MKRNITIKDIAQLAHVSASTVSRGLNDSPLVAEETRVRIQKIALEHGFSFNTSARSLITRKTGIIGLIYPEHFNEYQHSFYLTLLMNKIRDELEEHEYDLVVKFRTNKNGTVNNIRHLVNGKKVDGLILVHSKIEQEDLDFLHENGVPFVLLQARQYYVNIDRENWVFVNHRKGGYIAANHLISLGHTSILCMMLDSPQYQFTERTEGYKQALQDNHLQVDEDKIVLCDGTFEASFNFITEQQELMKQVTAIFAQTDIMALGAIEALQGLGLSVPKDIAVVAYDDIEFGKHFRPKLSTIHQPRDQLAVLGCERLLEMLDSGSTNPPMQRLIEPYLIVRESCGAER
ncbi:MAG: LacI family DNA-binding transcriptional regulator [Spirochaetia bacterium]